jgi:hypothetical protein
MAVVRAVRVVIATVFVVGVVLVRAGIGGLGATAPVVAGA